MAVNTQPWFVDHLAQWQTNPVAAHDWDATPVGGSGIVPTLLLTTHGAKSGERRSLPLLYQPCGEGFLIVGSRGGSNRHPGWYLNLLQNPRCTVQTGKLICETHARTLAGEEHDRCWNLMTRFWPAYLDYQARTTRRIPIVKLTIESVSLQSPA